MIITLGLLLAAAAMGALLWQRERHQRQHTLIAVTRIQLDWLTHLTTHPELGKLWAPEDIDPEEYIRHIHVNQHICALHLKYALGILKGSRLRVTLSQTLEREIVRRYWERFMAARAEEAVGDAVLTGFNAVMQDTYAAHTETPATGTTRT